MEAAKIGSGEVASAIIAATLTTVIVFLPLIFVEGIASQLFTPLASLSGSGRGN
ncbi:multidrug efflux pump subunit AcrB [Desulfitispora alkaliphila]